MSIIFCNFINENKNSIFFNMGIYGGCYRFETEYELLILQIS